MASFAMIAVSPKSEWFPLGRADARRVLRRIVPRVRRAIVGEDDPSVTAIARKTRSPFKVLVSTVISARTKDEVTGEASRRLFSEADSPEQIAALPVSRISKLIFPAGFYKTKGKAIKALSRKLITDFEGRVPDTIEELLTLPGVGRKTANLVLTLGFGKPGICVDTHVHRMVNRLGVVKTKDPEQTEYALRAVLPEEHWIEINDLLVTYGKGVCAPISPFCSKCAIKRSCSRIGVGRSR